MTYDVSEINRRISRKKRKFFLILFASVAVITLLAVLMLLGVDRRVTFASGVLAAVVAFFAIRNLRALSPGVIFCREIEGENILESEAVVGGHVRIYQRWNAPRVKSITGGDRAFGRVNAPRGGSTPPPPGCIRGTVYLRHDDGNVSVIEGLSAAQMELYVEGDRLVRHPGTKYPQIIGRPTDEQPCPLCGEINTAADTACRRCGLGSVE